ncbi:YkoP family protein [Virgibacillus sediminis]|uniref:YkoP-like domain-containing protein n=1 Tax=Virgibacillus sediminis TaxID=202260 RepID=A0ABV7A426_9BACI
MKLQLRKICILFWDIVDPIYYRFTRLQHIESSEGEKTVIRARLTRYKGKSVQLSDGTMIKKNDVLLKIHLHNVMLLRKMEGYGEVRKAIFIYKSVQESLPFIAKYLQSQGYDEKVKGLIGITLLHRGCRKLGFDTRPISNPYYKYFKKAALAPIHFLSSARSIQKNESFPMYLFMSKDHLFRKYSNG